ncbi:hypothetical protein [Paenibacillus oceani]|uniref:Uncharacterized protein n=1 Tax=Paenibacillus oceani TaxID=2772510 RepID=A0A927GZE3_9BACL|nr:hypothetical protein [Paenibacillus oceani]MBD2861379.1 hypothetical protein [Paenibacillus oceani]
MPADEPAAASEPDVLRWAGHDPGQYELLRQAEIDGKTGFVWRRTDYTPAPRVQDDLSINSFFHNRNEQTIKAMLDPESGRLVSFMRFDKASGLLCLSRMSFGCRSEESNWRRIESGSASTKRQVNPTSS